MSDRVLAVLAGCALFAALGSPVRSADAPESIGPGTVKADESFYDPQTQELLLRGNAELVVGGWTVQADELRYREPTGELTASGNIVLTRPGLRMLGESAQVWREEERIDVRNFRLGQPPYYIAGTRAHGTPDLIEGENVEVFYGEPAPLTPHAAARALRVISAEGRVERFEADGLRFTLGRFPLLGLGGLSRSTDNVAFDWETRAGFDDTLGLQLGVGLYLPIRPAFRPGGSIDVFSKRGVLFGPGARYGDETATARFAGTTDIGFIHDSGERGEDVLGRPIDADREFWLWRHQQRAERWTLNGELNWWGDPAVLRDFREDLFDRTHEPDSFVEAAWYGSNSILSAFARYRPNDFQVMPERLPEVRYDLLPTPLGATGILLEMQASAAALREKSIGGMPDLTSDRLDLYTAASRTFGLGSGIAVTPVAGGRVTHYFETLGDSGDYTRWLGELGFDARLRAQRSWNLQNPLWGIDGIRHVVEPRIEYRYIPSATKGRALIPPIDRPAFLTQLQPLGLGERRDLDALGPTDVLRVGLTNFVETRHEEYGSRRLLRFDLAADVRFSDEHDGDELSDLHSELHLTPADWFEAWFFARFDPDDATFDEFNSRFQITNGPAWSVGVDVDYLRHDISQMQVFGRYALDEASELFGAVRYDGREHRVNEAVAGIMRRLHQNWELRCSVHVRKGQQRESGFGLKLDLNFLAF